MLKTKIASLALAGLMTVGGAGITAFATEPVETADNVPVDIMEKADKERTEPRVSFNKEAKRAELDERALNLENAKPAMEERLIKSEKTKDEIIAMKEKMAEKFAKPKDRKGDNRGAKLATADEKGIVKGNKNIGDAI